VPIVVHQLSLTHEPVVHDRDLAEATGVQLRDQLLCGKSPSDILSVLRSIEHVFVDPEATRDLVVLEASLLDFELDQRIELIAGFESPFQKS
jgi:hypothetical protein